MKIAPCPFCKATTRTLLMEFQGRKLFAVVGEFRGQKRKFIECHNCGAKGPVSPFKKYAISFWNLAQIPMKNTIIALLFAVFLAALPAHANPMGSIDHDALPVQAAKPLPLSDDQAKTIRERILFLQRDILEKQAIMAKNAATGAPATRGAYADIIAADIAEIARLQKLLKPAWKA